MPPDPDQSQPLWILPFGAVALALVVWSGWWRPSRLAAAPPRPSDLQPWDLLVALVLWVAGQSVMAMLLPRLTGGADIATLSTIAHAGLVLLSQVVGQGPAAAYFIWRAMGAPPASRGLGLRLPRPGDGLGREVGLAAAALLVALPLVLSAMTLATWLGQRLGQPAPEVGHQLLEVLRDSGSPMGVALLLASVTLVGPVIEELIYRGLIQSVLLAQLGAGRRVWVIVVASGLFAAVHMGPATFNPEMQGGVPWQALPGLFVLALVLGWLYERTGSLWPSILAHAGFNAFNAGLVLVMARA